VVHKLVYVCDGDGMDVMTDDDAGGYFQTQQILIGQEQRDTILCVDISWHNYGA
jgi:hypothetical protein